MKGLPEVLARREEDVGLELDLHIPANSPWFDGHFADHPILPGVVQVGWAAWFADRWHPRTAPPTDLKRVKFKRPIGPEARLTLHLQEVRNKVRYEYMLTTPEGPVSASSGVLAWPDDAP